MLNSDAFSYVNILDKTLDASWTRQTAIANRSLDQAVRHADLDSLDAQVYTDHSNFSYRIDKNNVDVDTENVELASEQLRYQELTTSLRSQFSRFTTAAKSS